MTAQTGIAAFFVGVVAITNGAAAQTYPPSYPRPNATKVLDNDRVTAWDVYWPGRPAHAVAYPCHQRQFSITLARRVAARSARLTANGAKAHMSQVGSVNFVPAGTTHREEGMSEIPQHKIMLEIKPSPLHPDVHGTAPGEGAVMVFENDRLVAWDMAWKPGVKISRPPDGLDFVTGFVDGGTIRVATSSEPADISWGPGRQGLHPAWRASADRPGDFGFAPRHYRGAEIVGQGLPGSAKIATTSPFRGRPSFAISCGQPLTPRPPAATAMYCTPPAR